LFAAERGIVSQPSAMFKHNAAILGFWAMVALAQVLGFGVSRPLRSLYARLWVWPITAALAFALEWYIAWSIPARQSLEAGQRVCGAAGALLFVGIVVLAPANGVVGGIFQTVLAYIDRRRERSRG
jgi:hypothetical protein